MTIQPIGATSVALYLTPDDLHEHGLTPSSLTRALAMELTRNAFQRAGMPVDGLLEIEAYPDVCGVLVFARMETPRRLWFRFSHLEELLSAARMAAPDAPDAALTFWEGGYWLSVPDVNSPAVCRLSEFGDPTETAPFFEARLAEHGLTVIPSRALSVLLRYFPT